MGTGRDHAPHWTPARGLIRPQSPRPCAYPSPVFITSVLPPRLPAVPRPQGCHHHPDLHLGLVLYQNGRGVQSLVDALQAQRCLQDVMRRL